MSTSFYITKLEVYLSNKKVSLSLSGGGLFFVISKHYYIGLWNNNSWECLFYFPFGNSGPGNRGSWLHKVSDLPFANIKAVSCSQKDTYS